MAERELSIKRLAKMLHEEIESDGKQLADQLWSEMGPAGGREVSLGEFHQWIREGWIGGGVVEGTPLGPVEWRMNLLERLGPDSFWEQAHRAFGAEPPRVDQEMLATWGTEAPLTGEDNNGY